MKNTSFLFGLAVLCLGAAPSLRGGTAASLHGRELARYDETVVLGDDGSAAIRLALTIADGPEPLILIPLRHRPLRGLEAKGIDPASLRVMEGPGGRFVALDLAKAGAGPLRVEISFAVEDYFAANGAPAPFGDRQLAYRFVNVSSGRIGKFSAVLVLPAGYAFHAITDFSPQPGKSGAAVPYSLYRADGRNVGRIAADDVRLGDEVALRCSFKSTKKSPWLLLALIAVAIAYLIFFRGLLKNGNNAAAAKP